MVYVHDSIACELTPLPTPDGPAMTTAREPEPERPGLIVTSAAAAAIVATPAGPPLAAATSPATVPMATRGSHSARACEQKKGAKK